MYYIYILKDKKSKALYYGYTKDLKQRFKQHNARRSRELIYYESYKAESDARNRERRLKHYAQALTALKGRLIDSLQ
jgi:putative endonuclease